MKVKHLFILFSFLITPFLIAQETQPIGSIKGNVVDGEGLFPLIGVNVIVKDKNIGTATDLEGKFELRKLPVGNYTLVFSYIGYEQLTKTDIIVRPDRITFVDAGLKQSSVKMNDVVVNAGYFSRIDDLPASAVSFSSEEIRRSPGSAGDVSRILFGLPSLAKLNDQKNSLIVRGGSPIENSFFVDNIEIPNINHYGTQGSSEGPIGLINIDFLKNVNFIAGGFGVNYGDRLSSVMEMTFREGNREQFDLQLDASFMALGGQIEGPIANGKGSFLFSVKRSYLDWVFKSTEINGPIPTYYDLHFKIVYDISDKVKLSVLNIGAIDKSYQSYDEGIKFEDNYFGGYSGNKNTAGINLLCLWGTKGYSNFTFSHTILDIENDVSEVSTKNYLYENNSIEQDFSFRNSNHFVLGGKANLQFGFDFKYTINNYDHHYFPFTDRFGYTTPELVVKNKSNGKKAGAFINFIWNPVENLSIIPGFRIDYFDFTKRTNISPRLNISYNINETTQIYSSGGLFSQTLPYIVLSQNKTFADLKNPFAIHAIVGFSHLLTEDTKLSIELYDKEYGDCPINPNQPEAFVLDQAVENPVFMNNVKLANTGKAYSRGVEIILQKKLAKNFYGMLSASYFRSRYQDGLGIWRDRAYDNRFTFAAEGGYKPNEEWEFSLRWIYAGGTPYTPFDSKASQAASKGIVDVTKIYGERLPDYHSLNLRVDKRFHFYNSSIVLYVSIWNVYGKENIWGYSWDETKNKIKALKSWSTLPVFGVEYEL